MKVMKQVWTPYGRRHLNNKVRVPQPPLTALTTEKTPCVDEHPFPLRAHPNRESGIFLLLCLLIFTRHLLFVVQVVFLFFTPTGFVQ